MLRVIAYHRIAEASDNPDLDPALVSASPDSFRRQMEHLRRWYRPLSLREIVEAFDEGRAFPSRAVHVTVDDAYRDFKDTTWPILRALGIPVTLFVPTAYPGEQERSFWWDRLHRAGDAATDSDAWRRLHERTDTDNDAPPPFRRTTDLRAALRLLPHDDTESLVDQACRSARDGGRVPTATAVAPSVLSWDELRALQAEGVGIGTHTRHHVALTRADPGRVREEIRLSLADLDRELGQARRPIAYPYAMWDASVARIAQEEGCVLGFTGDDGLNQPGTTDPMRLHRSNITPRTSPSLFAIRMLPWCANVDRWRHRHERLSRMV